ncbi:hypothetical protein GCM10008995_00550 [Halobellus salinus]|uniref:Transporter n=1 Tax=Halobellus salinus TaxID=931585 RepID=A0A830EIE3_9EURY|nr:hypothetical protein [Halobellus salinus]GGI94254.1 hypothetical protein GCM10008995_00550 [Halobellus salinus]SMP19683.1 hypothetical protein SAMN06265347_10758 [Halobellus salinus]
MTYDAAAGTATTAQIGDLSAILGLSGRVYAGISFLAVLVAGFGLLVTRSGFVDRAVDRVIEESPFSVLYGTIPFFFVAFAGGYALNQFARAGVGSLWLAQGWSLVVSVVGVGFAGLGYLVFGTYLTEVEGERRPWHGAVAGAVVSALPWLLLPTLPAVLVWLLGAAAGLGAPTRRWVHGERTVETEASG